LPRIRSLAKNRYKFFQEKKNLAKKIYKFWQMKNLAKKKYKFCKEIKLQPKRDISFATR
jgi:hypothetical protein